MKRILERKNTETLKSEREKREKMRSVSAWEKGKKFDDKHKVKRRRSFVRKSKRKVRDLIYKGGAKRSLVDKNRKNKSEGKIKIQEFERGNLVMPLKR